MGKPDSYIFLLFARFPDKMMKAIALCVLGGAAVIHAAPAEPVFNVHVVEPSSQAAGATLLSKFAAEDKLVALEDQQIRDREFQAHMMAEIQTKSQLLANALQLG